MNAKEELKQFIERLANARIIPPTKPEHPDHVRLFYDLVDDAQRLLKLSAMDMAQIFDVSVPTANRWLSGENAPHPAMFPWVYKAFREIAQHIIEEHDGEA